MKKIVLALLSIYNFQIIIHNSCQAQSPNWLWASGSGSPNMDYSASVASDSSGNTIVAGYFNDSITFGSTTLYSAGSNDIFIAWFDAAGNPVWAVATGGTSVEAGYGVAMDKSGNAIVTGYYASSYITFGSITLNRAGTGSELFLVKFDPAGNVIWAKREGGADDEYGYGVAVDTNDNILVTGYFNTSTFPLGGSVLTSNGSGDILLAKYDSAGNPLWATAAGGLLDDIGYAIAADRNGNAIITGTYNSGSMTIGTTTLNNSSPGSKEIYIAKYDSLGNALWAVSGGGNGSDEGRGVAADGNGNVYVAGSFNSDSILVGTTTLYNTSTLNDRDVFFAKYSDSGNLVWAHGAVGNNDDECNGVATDDEGNFYMTGSFYSTTITFDTLVLTKAAGKDIFVVKCDSSANGLWAKSAADVIGNSIDVNSNGFVFVAGIYDNASLTLGPSTLPWAGGYDAFVAKLDTLSLGTGLENMANQNEIFLYPNPAGETLNVISAFASLRTGKSYTENGNQIVTILNVMGEEVLQLQLVRGTTQTIDISALSSGIYFLQLKSEDRIVVRKFIKR